MDFKLTPEEESFRDEVRASDPGISWLWDAAFVPSILAIPAVMQWLGRLEILVDGDALRLRFGFWRPYEKRIPLADVLRAEAVRYRPIRQFGGWGIRWGRFGGQATSVYSIRGNEGVLLVLSRPVRTLFFHTGQVLIGSLQPERLAAHLNALRASR